MRSPYERRAFAAAIMRAAFARRRPRAAGGENSMSHNKRFALIEAIL
jgi:hypothetical protein